MRTDGMGATYRVGATREPEPVRFPGNPRLGSGTATATRPTGVVRLLRNRVGERSVLHV